MRNLGLFIIKIVTISQFCLMSAGFYHLLDGEIVKGLLEISINYLGFILNLFSLSNQSK